MKLIIIVLLIIIHSPLLSKELICKFEEVYADGNIQSGSILLKDQSIRYQYSDKQLFTIIHHKNNTFVVRNDDIQVIQKLNQDKNLIDEIFFLFNQEKVKNREYSKDQLEIKAEKSLNTNFYKRISIVQNEMKLSIYFNSCEYLKIPIRYFNHNPLEEFIN